MFYGCPRSCGPRSDPEGCHASCGRFWMPSAFCTGRCSHLFLPRKLFEAENLRLESFRKQWPDYRTMDHPDGYLPCVEPFKKKFACVDCRRSFKPAIIHGNQYHYDFAKDGGAFQFEVRTAKTRMPELWEQYEKMGRRKKNLGWAGFMREHEKEINRMGRPWLKEGWIALDKVRCPGCGEVGKEVGEMFEVPARKDDRAWARVRKSLEENPDGYAQYQTKDRGEELVRERARLKAKEQDREAWEQERKRRIDALKNAVSAGTRTVQEETRLIAIRQRQEDDI